MSPTFRRYFIFLLLKEKFEEQYGSKIHYILQKKQIALAHLCKIDNYSIDEYEFFNDETGAYRFNVREISSFKNGVYVSIFSTLPQINTPFVAIQIPWLNEKYKWGTIVKAWSAALGINEERLDPPKMQLEMSLEFRNKLNSIDDLNNIVFLAPDARANISVPDAYFHICLVTAFNKRFF